MRNYTYRFPELNNLSLSSSFYRLGFVPEFFVIPLVSQSNSNVNTTTFNLIDGTSVHPFALIIFIRTLIKLPDSGGVLAADLCALSFCAQKRNVSVSLNRLSSTILQTVYGTIIEHQDGDSGESTKWLSFRGDNFNLTHLSQVDEWAVVLQVLINSFKGNVTKYAGMDFPSAIIAAAFNSSSNISMTMDNIATAMTNHFRGSSNITVTGQTGHTESYVHVNWLWITLPAVLVIMGTIFLMLAMFETKKLGARVWKTSELALLFHGLEEKSGQELNKLLESSEMENMASKTKVKVAKTSGGRWILRREID